MPASGFSPKARWDRRIPEETPYNPNQLNEKIQVLALFKGAKIYPRMFIWHNRKYRVKNITYYWQQRQGKEIISYFSVGTNTNLYQISFNNTDYSWKLNKIIE